MKLNAQDREWQRQSDARTLAEAKVIESTPTRLKGATSEAKKMAKQSQKDAAAMTKVANRGARRNTGKRSGGVSVMSNTSTPLSRANKKRK